MKITNSIARFNINLKEFIYLTTKYIIEARSLRYCTYIRELNEKKWMKIHKHLEKGKDTNKGFAFI